MIVLGWRLGKAWQVARADTMQRARAASYGSAGQAPGGRAGQVADQGRAVRGADGLRGQVAAAGPRDRPAAGAGTARDHHRAGHGGTGRR